MYFRNFWRRLCYRLMAIVLKIWGFKASGIYPLNKNAVLSKLPDDVKQKDTTANTSFSEQLMIMLKEERFGKSEERAIPRKRRLIDVEPGASVTEEQAHQLLVKKLRSKKIQMLKTKTRVAVLNRLRQRSRSHQRVSLRKLFVHSRIVQIRREMMHHCVNAMKELLWSKNLLPHQLK